MRERSERSRLAAAGSDGEDAPRCVDVDRIVTDGGESAETETEAEAGEDIVQNEPAGGREDGDEHESEERDEDAENDEDEDAVKEGDENEEETEAVEAQREAREAAEAERATEERKRSKRREEAARDVANPDRHRDQAPEES